VVDLEPPRREVQVQSMNVRPGQIFYSANPANNNRRIKVTGFPSDCNMWSRGKVNVVTIDDQGRELRPRLVKMSELHTTVLTRDGNSRRRGYILEK
jgi:hypothetical protein